VHKQRKSRNKAEVVLIQALRPSRVPTELTCEEVEVLELRLRLTELRKRLTVRVKRGK
jgi:hypothetical protein